MPVGMRMPVGVDEQGGAAMSAGSDYIHQLLITALRDCESRNPFQDLGISERNIFDIDDPVTRGRLMTRVKDVFARFEAQSLARLASGSSAIRWAESEADGEAVLEVQYIDMESNRNQSVQVTIPGELR